MRPVLDCGHRRMEYESALTRNLIDEEFKKLMAEQRVFEAKRKKKYAGTKPLSTPAGATLQNAVGYVQTCGLNVTNTVTTNVEPSVDVLRSERSIIGENNE